MIGEKDVVCVCVCVFIKKQNWVICRDMDGPKDYHAE